MNKNKTRLYITIGIVFAAFSVIAFAVPFHKNGTFWIAYLFGVIALGVQLYAMPKAFGGESIRSKFYGFPVARIAFIYLIAQLALSLVAMIAATFAEFPLWVILVVSVLLLGAAAVGFISADAVHEDVERQDVKLKKDVTAMRALQSKANFIAGQCENDAVKPVLQKLAEQFCYSDPVSNDATHDAEAELAALLDDLQSAVMEKDFSGAQTLCGKTELCLAERNRLCKLNK